MIALFVAGWIFTVQEPPPGSAGRNLVAPTSGPSAPSKLDARPVTTESIGYEMTSPLKLVQVVLGPVRDAPQLLPWRTTPPDELDGAFKPSEQKKYLETALAGREDTPDDKATFKYSIEGGGNFRQGDASATNIHSSFSSERRSSLSTFTTKFGATYNEVSGSLTNRRFFGDAVYDRNLRGRWLAYGREELENDAIRHIELRSVSSLGLGYRLIDSLKERWVARTGPTYTYLQQNPVDGSASISSNQSGWLIESDYRRVLGEASRLEWTTTAYPNFANSQSFRIRNEAAVLFPIGGVKSAWNWKVGARQEYTQNPLVGTKSQDVEVYFSIVFANK